jgi:hypothetical protein
VAPLTGACVRTTLLKAAHTVDKRMRLTEESASQYSSLPASGGKLDESANRPGADLCACDIRSPTLEQSPPLPLSISCQISTQWVFKKNSRYLVLAEVNCTSSVLSTDVALWIGCDTTIGGVLRKRHGLPKVHRFRIEILGRSHGGYSARNSRFEKRFRNYQIAQTRGRT